MKSLKNSILLGILFFSVTAFSQQSLVSRIVLNNKVSIYLPKNFVLMQNEMLEIKYPILERRPTEVYTNESGSINIAFSLTKNQITQKSLPEIEKVFKNQFISTPNITFNSSEIKLINGQKYVIFDFYSQAVDTKVYNLMFITSINNRMFLGNFNCTIEQLAQWKTIGHKIVNSVNVFK